MLGCEATPQRRDLDTRGQIHDLVIHFYREVMLDPLLGPVFDEVAEVDWPTHIPKLIDFWCRVLLGQPGYDGFILNAHQRVHDIESFEPELFDRWYLLFVEAVDGGWDGPIADTAKVHAARMAAVLCRRLLGVEWDPRFCGDEHIRFALTAASDPDDRRAPGEVGAPARTSATKDNPGER